MAFRLNTGRSQQWSSACKNKGELVCLCLVSALVIQPVLLRSVLMRFVHITRSDNHLLEFCIPHYGVFLFE